MQRRATDMDKQVGKRVRVRRLELGMSQSKLAGQLGLSFQQLQKYESGANRIGAARLKRLSELLDVPLTYFFGEAKEKFTAALEMDATRASVRLVRAFSKVKRSDRMAIITLTESLAGLQHETRS